MQLKVILQEDSHEVLPSFLQNVENFFPGPQSLISLLDRRTQQGDESENVMIKWCDLGKVKHKRNKPFCYKKIHCIDRGSCGLPLLPMGC